VTGKVNMSDLPAMQLTTPLVGSLSYAVAIDCQPWILAAAPSLLSMAERERLRKIRNDLNRRRFLLARLALRLLLSPLLNVEPTHISIARCPTGRPYLPDISWDFSISHADSWIFLAIHPRLRVGVDLEGPRSLQHPERLLQRIGGDPHTNDTDIHNTVLQRWTSIEASLKTVGLGLGRMHDLKPLTENSWQIDNRVVHAENFSFAPNPEYHAAIAWLVEPSRYPSRPG